MSSPALAMMVRFKTALTAEQAKEVMERRAPEFAAIEGLKQKYYLQHPATGELMGLYIWESAEELAKYRDSELRASIASSYRAVGEPNVEVFDILKVLRDQES